MPPVEGTYITLADGNHLLRYTMRALHKLDVQRGGEPLLTTLSFASRFSAQAICALVWAGLLHENPKLKYEQVAALVEPPMIPIVTAITKALEPWLASADENANEEEAVLASDDGDELQAVSSLEGSGGKDLPI